MYKEYTIKPKATSIIKLLILIIIITALSNIINAYYGYGKVFAIASMSIYIYRLIRYDLPTYIYRLSEDHMILEKVMGPFNYVFFRVDYDKMQLDTGEKANRNKVLSHKRAGTFTVKSENDIFALDDIEDLKETLLDRRAHAGN